MRIYDKIKLGNGKTVCICKIFIDDIITNTIFTGDTTTKDFVVENVINCMTTAKTRYIVFGTGVEVSGNEIRFL